MTFPSALEISRRATLAPPEEVTAKLPRKTRPAERMGFGDQVVQDRSGPPEQDMLLLPPQERLVYPICGDMRTMPGLPVHRIDLDGHGEVTGLS
jgi:hypothetical protein